MELPLPGAVPSRLNAAAIAWSCSLRARGLSFAVRKMLPVGLVVGKARKGEAAHCQRLGGYIASTTPGQKSPVV